MKMKYQLVLQFPEEKYGDFDWIADIENRLEERLIDAVVDGHDIGSGEVNIFIDTNAPVETFETIKKTLEENSELKDVKVAYRDFNAENYVCLWPIGLTEFQIV